MLKLFKRKKHMSPMNCISRFVKHRIAINASEAMTLRNELNRMIEESLEHGSLFIDCAAENPDPRSRGS